MKKSLFKLLKNVNIKKIFLLFIKRKEKEEVDNEFDISLEEIKLVNENIEYLSQEIEDCDGYYEDGYHSVILMLPPYNDEIEIDIEIFNESIAQFKTVRFYKDYIITDNYIFLQVNTNITQENHELYESIGLINTGVGIDLYYEPDILLPALIKYNEGYIDNELLNDTHYIVLEKTSEIKDEDIISHFTIFEFEISKHFGLVFTRFNEEDLIDKGLLNSELIINGVIIGQYPIGCVTDYIEAKKITNQRVKYVLFFRILEYISVTTESVLYNNSIKPKLLLFELVSLTIVNIESINYILGRDKGYGSKKYKGTDLLLSHINERKELIYNDIKSENYIKSLLKTLDIKNLIHYLPISIIKSHVKGGNINIEVLTMILTFTRHKYSHATPLYILKGCECEDEELEQLNEFMDKLVLESINWYMKLSEHQKIK